VLRVRLANGEAAQIEPAWLVEDEPDPQIAEGGAAGGPDDILDLGSEEEAEDEEREEGVVEGSDSIRPHGGGEGEDWVPCEVRFCPREQEGFAGTAAPRLPGVEEAQREDPFAFFLAFLPREEVEEAVRMMQQKGEQLWPGFQLSFAVFLQWLGLCC
jgi:hypothetical protein